ncbi:MULTISPECIES: NUDIX hydrolase [Acidiplasma]|uniref:Nudix hydrolase domain-containing protein n=2 Tax=Acidiplasma TaxID=507753 RepID=A0A0Q0RJG4_9ARCH|nr:MULTISPECIES: NUDIX hydrolase [Acidiplasma]KJE49264.1 hypothetical protein TZ01_04165 [Acidiplasma sp. MBA-1]KQB34566.1 hypothetical protein AOG54_00780 [Acidiplasma aeolicum]KQB35557.1 hypothetical protein AOG55_00490 [Acidiplasma cupricumulans]WMT54762.1 MAG: NUDIX hydrolase [Acidiplasma sp.]
MIRLPKIAVGGIIIKNNQVLLGKRRDEPNKNKWAIPGGKVNLNETLEEALKREMHEETGLIIKTGKLMAVAEFINTNFHYVILDYECIIMGGNLKAGSDSLEIKFFDINSLNGNEINETTIEFFNKIKTCKLPVSIVHREI